MTIKATRSRKSWEKQTVYNLANGCQITLEYSIHYGEMVSRCDDAKGYWHASNGVHTIPDRFAFLRDWLRPMGQNPAIGLGVYPQIEIV